MPQPNCRHADVLAGETGITRTQSFAVSAPIAEHPKSGREKTMPGRGIGLACHTSRFDDSVAGYKRWGNEAPQKARAGSWDQPGT